MGFKEISTRNLVEMSVEKMSLGRIISIMWNVKRIVVSQVRPISVRMEPLPAECVHGSSLFTRGETQVLPSTIIIFRSGISTGMLNRRSVPGRA